jgi:hypothetical protein
MVGCCFRFLPIARLGRTGKHGCFCLLFVSRGRCNMDTLDPDFRIVLCNLFHSRNKSCCERSNVFGVSGVRESLRNIP